jgi:DNA-directed RNA polymerase specialized sigma24 family protein
MVLGVCRRLLDDPNAAAFQAAFLLLARKGRSIRADGAVGGWLHRVAWRIALQVKYDAARRRDQERRAAELAGEPFAAGPRQDDTAAVIHEEIDRLPDLYRRPVVLCYLEDMTYQQAADQLRWTEATTRGRLARGRDLLRARLTRRGVTLAGTGLSIAGIASPSTASAVPAALLQCSVRAARQIVLGESAAAVSTTTIVLMKQAARTMMIARLKAIAAAALLVATLTGLATGLTATGIGDDGQKPEGSRQVMKGGPAPAVAETATRPIKGETMSVPGRVLTPDGKPAVGADVVVVVNLPRPLTQSVETSRVLGPARTDPAGRFLLELPRKVLDNACMADMVAYLPGYAAGVHGTIDDQREVTIRLEPEEPIRIRLLDLEGAEWTCIATRAVFRCACRAQVPNPFVAKCFGFPSSAWARQIYLLSERTLERASDGAPGPAIGAADFTGQRVGDRPGAAVHVFSSCCPPDDRTKPIIDDNRATPLGNQLDFAALASPLSV